MFLPVCGTSLSLRDRPDAPFANANANANEGGTPLGEALAENSCPEVLAECGHWTQVRLPGEGRGWLDHHTHLADLWAPLLYADAALALLAMGSGVWRG